MMLLGGYLVNAATTETVSSAQTENAKEVVAVHLYFNVDAQTVRFSCPDWSRYHINEISVYIHNVDIHYWTGRVVDYNTTACVQLFGTEDSEVTPVIVTPESYVAIAEIQVNGSDAYEYDFVITGIPAW